MTGRPRDELGRPLPRGAVDRLRADAPGALGLAPAAAARRAWALLDAGRCFEAHEFLEYVWKHPDTEDARRPAWKAATQIAVGWCHLQRGNRRGAVALLRRGAAGLRSGPAASAVDPTARRLGARAAAAADSIEAGATPDPPG